MKNLAVLRKARGLTQAELGELLGCGASQIAAWERLEIEPRLMTACKIAGIFRVSVEYLCDFNREFETSVPDLRGLPEG